MFTEWITSQVDGRPGAGRQGRAALPADRQAHPAGQRELAADPDPRRRRAGPRAGRRGSSRTRSSTPRRSPPGRRARLGDRLPRQRLPGADGDPGRDGVDLREHWGDAAARPPRRHRARASRTSSCSTARPPTWPAAAASSSPPSARSATSWPVPADCSSRRGARHDRADAGGVRRLVRAHPGRGEAPWSGRRPHIGHSYYKNADGEVHGLNPWRLVDYWAWTRDPDPDRLRGALTGRRPCSRAWTRTCWGWSGSCPTSRVQPRRPGGRPRVAGDDGRARLGGRHVRARRPGPAARRLRQPGVGAGLPADGRRGPLPGLLHLHGGGFVLGSVDVEHQVCVDLARSLGVVVVERRVPARARAPLPRRARGLLRRAPPAGRAARGRPGPGRGARPERGRRARRRGSPAGPRPRRAGAVLPVARRAGRSTTGWRPRRCARPGRGRCGARARRPPRGGSTSTAGRRPVRRARAAPRTWPACPRRTSSTCELDPLRDEGNEYAARLMTAGVSVELHCWPGTFHGVQLVPGRRDREADVRRAAGRPGEGAGRRLWPSMTG